MLLSKSPYLAPDQRPSIDVRWVTLVTPRGDPASLSLSPAASLPPAPVTVTPKAVKVTPPPKTPPTEPEHSQPDNNSQQPIGSPAVTDIRVDHPDFHFLYYLNLIRYRIQENWRPPQSSARPDTKAMVRFHIARNGAIKQVALEHPSGNFLFDQSAQRAVQLIQRFPPLPEEFQEEELVVHLEFEGLP